MRRWVDYFLDYGGGSSSEMKMVDYFMECGSDGSLEIKKKGEVCVCFFWSIEMAVVVRWRRKLMLEKECH